MATSVTVQNVQYAPNGYVYVNYTDGTQEEFPDRAALLAADLDLETDANLVRKIARRMWLKRSPDGSDPAWINGRTFEFDPALDLNPFAHGVV